MKESIGLATRAVRAGLENDSQYGAVVPPVHLSSNFTFAGYGRPRKHDYTRSGNPTRDLLAEALADMEGGVGAAVTATGMAAIALVLQLLKPGERLLVPHDCYGGSYRLFTAWAAKGQFELTVVDQTDEQALAAALEEKPKLVWIETPSNPLLRVVDIARLAAASHEVGALVAVDNTFLSPVLQQPLALGADIVVHSTTKYLNGHSDVVGGAVISAQPALHEQISWWANCLGVTGAPFDSYLTLRGLRTLSARMRVHEDNAHALLEVLCAHPAVARVYYPGLPEHPGHNVARRQQRGFGAMLSFDLKNGEAAVRRFLSGLKHFSLAESLGGVESLVAHPATMTHAAMGEDARRVAGISDSLIRVSVGIEATEDLTTSLQRALDGASSKVKQVAAC